MRLLLALAVLLLVALIGLTLWLRSGSALRWALAQAESRTHGALHVQSSEGALDRVMVLHGLDWDSGSLHAHIDTLTLQWRPVALFIRRVSLSTVRAEGVRVEVRSTGPGKSLTFPLQPPVMPLLPVSLALGRVEASDITFSPSPTAPPIRLDSLAFSARVDNDAIQVHELEAHGPDLTVQGEARLAPRHDYGVDAALDWDFTQPGWAALHGHTELKGDDRALTLRQSLTAPYATSLTGTLKDAFTAPTWDGELKLAHLELGKVRAGWPDYGLDTRLGFRGGLAATALKGEATLRGAPFVHGANARFDATLKREALDLRTLILDFANGGRVDLQGSLGLTADARTSLSGGWKDLSWPLDAPEIVSPQGQVRLEGDRDAWRADLNGAIAPKAQVQAALRLARNGTHAWTLTADASGLRGDAKLKQAWMKPLLPQGHWLLAAHGDLAGGTLDKLTGRWLGGRLTASGRYQQASRHWQAHAEVVGADTTRLSRQWPGKLAAVLDGTGELPAGAPPRTQIKLQTLKGTLRGSPLLAGGNAAFTGGDWQQVELDARLGDDALHLDGDNAGTRLNWRVDAPDLAQAWPDASGALHSQGQLDAGRHYTLLQADLDLTRFAWHRWQAEGLHFSTRASGDAGGGALLRGVGVALPGIQLSQLDARADGSLARHTLRVDMDSDRGALHLAGDGAYEDKRWQGTLSHVDLAPAGAGLWHAATPWSLMLEPHVLKLPLACLVQDKARACASLEADKQRWKAQGSLTALPLSSLQSLLPPGLTYAGTLDATLAAGGGAQSHHLDLDARLSPGRVSNSAGGKEITLLDYTGGEAHLHSNPRLTTGRVTWRLSDGGDLNADVRIAGTEQRLSGRIRGDMHDFELVPALLPQVSQAKGRLTLDVALAGTPADPQFSGNATFSGGEVTVARIGLHMTDLKLKLDGNGDLLNLEGGARSGGGDLALTASARRDSGTWHVQGRLRGQDFRSVDIPEAQLDLSPDIGFAADGRNLRVDGNVTVPHADIRPRDLTGSAQVSADQVIVGEEGGLPEEKWHLRSQVKVIMGPDVRVDGFGLSGRVTGAVTAGDEPGHATTGNGELGIEDGRYEYKAIKQSLAIEYGRLMFTGGPISDPALDIRAVRAATHPELVQLGSVEQKVGVIVRGTLRDPLVTLFSDPPLPQAQMTNYLLFGTPGLEGTGSALSTPGVVTASSLSSNSNASANQSQAINVTIPLGGGSIASDFSIQSVQNGTTYTPSWMLGKYLSPRLYVSYGQGINDPFYFFRVIYTLSTKWILQAQTGAANSADIIYTLEH
ncbi:MAG TPA: translocation/assembly module TamB domain-containing protein [Gammaproteobacteria bacterium]|jgi:translocation and assembly module TamB|nr:translocation/assembly module TamB domain-containing protein [Gammaproteobacteria bacterium]